MALHIKLNQFETTTQTKSLFSFINLVLLLLQTTYFVYNGLRAQILLCIFYFTTLNLKNVQLNRSLLILQKNDILIRLAKQQRLYTKSIQFMLCSLQFVQCLLPRSTYIISQRQWPHHHHPFDPPTPTTLQNSPSSFTETLFLFVIENGSWWSVRWC